MAEVALAVMLVIGAGLLLRTVYNLANVDSGFDRSRLVTFQVTLPPAAYRRRRRARRSTSACSSGCGPCRASRARRRCRACRPNRQVDANDTDIEQLHRAPGRPVRERRLLPERHGRATSRRWASRSSQGRASRPRTRTSPGLVAIVNETLVRTFWKDLNPIGQQLRPCCGRRAFRGSRSSAWPRTSSRAASIRRPAPRCTSSSSRPPACPAARPGARPP